MASNPQNLNPLFNSGISATDRVKEYVNETVSTIIELDLSTFKKFLQLTSKCVYNFRQKRPVPKLAECMTTMIKDQEYIQVTDPMIGHYYNAMTLEFLQRSLSAVNAEQEHIDGLDPKIMESFNKFKDSAQLQ